MTEADPTQRGERQHLADRIGNQREQRPHAGVEQERFVGVDEDLVERHSGVGNERRDAEDVVGDLGRDGVHVAASLS
jgi:hypothetical protein